MYDNHGFDVEASSSDGKLKLMYKRDGQSNNFYASGNFFKFCVLIIKDSILLLKIYVMGINFIKMKKVQGK